MISWKRLWFGLLLCGLTGCGAAAGGRVEPPPQDPPRAARTFEDSLAQLSAFDRANSWTQASCDDLVSAFKEAAGTSAALRNVASYNAGVVELRCQRDARAQALFQEVLEREPTFHRARAQLARLTWAAGGDAVLPQVIDELGRSVTDSGFQNVEALVDLARAQMRRRDATADQDGENDLERAKRNLQRALAVDDGHLPAQNLLAQYYLARAKKAAPTRTSSRSVKRSSGETQAIDLALLVATQGLKKAPDDAQLLNTTGLVLVELGDLSQAVKYFKRAREVDSRFVEAQMNYASVNMMFRGFSEAEAAYRAVVALQPKDYDAHLGLALALRGQLDSTATPEKLLAESEALIEKAKQLDGARPEAYFNHAVLVQEYKSREIGKEGNAALVQAIGLYREFVKRAQGKPEFADAVEDVTAKPTRDERDCMGARGSTDRGCKRGRIFDIQDIVAFYEQSDADRARMAQEKATNDAVREVNADAPADPQPN